ncbi:SMI1/KNR4 family protein [Fictibacillus iocasae]|uniref:SMI1/KNR4 family protein n=1 Tax=Fictibacillus iocasae TaxID=2715437 RepID=A0ABW2NTA8_9BACL
METVIENILAGLKNRLHDGKLMIQSSGGYCYEAECLFHEPLTEYVMQQFERQTLFTLPKEYRQFLLLHNGMTLFKGTFEGHIELYRLEDIPNHYKTFRDAFSSYLDDDKKDSYPIGYYTNIGMIMIHNGKAKDGKEDYLWITSIDSIVLPHHFQTWLDRTIISQGSPYWSWCD